MRIVKIAVAVEIVVLAVAAAGAWVQVNADTPGYFPFWIPTFDASGSFTDMSFLNPEPAGAAGRVTIREGHFFDGHGRRLRLLGSNLCFHGAFPEKDQAPLMAAHLRKLGMNVIRFHHIDGWFSPKSLWLPDYAGFDPAQVDKLDWLIHQLKRHGIYVNLNLHVSRTYPGIPGDVPRAFRYGKGLDNFYPEFIRLQKEYARDLLTHRNPYTGTTYAEEPAVVVVEMNNENALTNIAWRDLRALPDPYRAELTNQWRAWLRDQYEDTRALRARWDEGCAPLGDELLANRDFEHGPGGWTREVSNTARMEVALVEDADVPAGRALKITTLHPGLQSWNLQFHQICLDLEDRAPYTLRFRARAEASCQMDVSVMLDQAPWRACGLRASVRLERAWREFTYTFKCVNPVPNHCRVSFNFNNRVGEFWLADVSLRRGGLIGLPPDQSLEAHNIPIPPTNASEAQTEDFYRFLQETECGYVREMRRFLREGLGVQAPICDTQASYGGLLGVYREGTISDYIDMHAYWQHPAFPGKPWDGADWYIANTPMAADPESATLGQLAWTRVFGKPFTVSEYDHPAPSDYAAELFPMLASFAAFQDWDGIYQFCYRSRGIVEEEHRLTGYFELWSHPGKLVFVPIAALMYRMGAVAPGRDAIVVTVPTGDAARQVALHPPYGLDFDLPRTGALRRRVGLELSAEAGAAEPPELETSGATHASDTGEIVWDASDEGAAVYTVNAAAVRVAVGYITGRTITLGDVSIEVTKAANGWAAVAVGALDGKPIGESTRVLVVAVGRVENSDMGWDDNRRTVSNHWGRAPVVAEGIEATLRVPGRGKVLALDGTGTPKGDVPSEEENGGLTFKLGPQHQTLWYGVTR